MATPLPFDSRAIGQEVLQRLAEIDRLTSPEHRQWVGQFRERHAAHQQRLADLTKSVDALTKVADVAARTEHNELIAQRTDTHDDAAEAEPDTAEPEPDTAGDDADDTY